MRKPRKEMIAETRAKLTAAARQAFGTVGYADASMDDFTAAAGLTRGALYHHFGDKKGLFQAVVRQIDMEMTERLSEISTRAPSLWQAVVDSQIAYIQMALEPEIQRIMFHDGPAVLGDISQWPDTNCCVMDLKNKLDALKADGLLVDVDPEAAARLINGASIHAATWIASSDTPEETSSKAVTVFRAILDGLYAGDPARS
ncbi:TetR/AcrR family transcriptional regulator [Roseovarius sp.]|uniref:TetR/AcrR family transcriptional regulator n=1 Tax=Roseovarius sp. TaxID=1486281 RepID=UPI003BACF654